MKFGTKAETLEALAPHLHSAQVPALFYFTVDAYRRNPIAILDTLTKRHTDTHIVVRSSAFNEDGQAQSMAGAYHSCLNVPGGCREAAAAAIDQVISSYSGNPLDQILVQPMLAQVALSGVILTHDLDSGAPYYIINYDDETGTTDRVTGGIGVNKTVVVHHDYRPEHIESPRIAELLAMVHEIQEICGDAALDIEFAKTQAGELFLLQARRITVQRNWNRTRQGHMGRALEQISAFVDGRARPHPGLLGQTTILGQMPDWNPAEIIGTHPRPLAVSLYRNLVTDSVWQEARAQMGYRGVPGETLMVLLAGRPYIDVRNSFNSFLPAGLEPETGAVLVDAWLARLASHPELHDKVEFQVAQTVVDFTFEQEFQARYPNVFSPERWAQYRQKLTALTRTALDLSPAGSLSQALAQVRALHQAQLQAASTDCSGSALLSHVVSVLDACRNQGTRPFAILARHAFIAETLLRTAVTRGALTPERLSEFKHSLVTVTGELTHDFAAVMLGAQDKERFLKRYGHLRPGTYDILSLRYDQREDLFRTTSLGDDMPPMTEFNLTLHERGHLERLLQEAGLDHITPQDLLEYARLAIVNREWSKFVFTRHLSDVIEYIARWGEEVGLPREDLSFLMLGEILDTAHASMPNKIDECLAQCAQTRRDAADVARHLRLGYILRDQHDLYVVPMHRSAPNFVTSHTLQGPIVFLDGRTTSSVDLFRKIVCIENADPGFDWIFTRGIAGLVSKFGGANSHMTIRCAELDLPAAIGVGEQTFERIVQAGHVDLRCADRVVRPATAGLLGDNAAPSRQAQTNLPLVA